jgi:4-hydroxy-tetrahydrodipicolinate synthase
LFDAIMVSDFPEGFRVGVEMRGFRMGSGRQPVSDQHRARLLETAEIIKQLFAEEGLDAGLSLSPDDLRRIVESVVAALRELKV